MKVLWLSRHVMTPDQTVGLCEWLDTDPADLVVDTVNHTFPPDSDMALDGLLDMVLIGGYTHVAGVFPANVAARIGQDGFEFPILIPVSVPTPEVDGVVRGFTFSHWEEF